MASSVNTGRSLTKIVAIVLLLALVALVIFAWREHRRADDAEQALGLDAGRVLSAVFTQARDLRVAQLKGEVLARSENEGRIFRTEQRTKAPYSVNYFVDLKKIGSGDLRWDRARRTMLVKVPDVTVEQPAIDWSKAQVEQDGTWISRSAGINLQRSGARILEQKADQKARSDEMMENARRAAVDAVTQYIRQPLSAAGFRDIQVEVVFPWQGYAGRERWDASRPVSEVLLER